MNAPMHPGSFAEKLTRFAVVTSGVAVILVSAVLALFDYVDLHRQTLDLIESQARIVALNSEAPMAFEDTVHGAEALAALESAPEVLSATLYRPDGRVFAEYLRPGADRPQGLAAPGHGRTSAFGTFVVPVADRGTELGNLQVVYRYDRLRGRLYQNIGISLLVAFSAMLISFIAGARMQRSLVRPISELARTARAVSDTRDYGLRAEKFSDDELGELTDAFNAMLTQIQERDQQIQEAHAQRSLLLENERRARSEAERASRMKDEFLAVLSHELRTPMTPILGWVHILRQTAGDPARLEQGIDTIERNARIQTRIIDDLLDMSRIVSGKIRLDVQQVNLIDVLEAATGTVRTAAEAKQIALTTDYVPGGATVRGDAARLQQVFWNLLSNAIKFTPKGGQVKIALRRVESHAEVTVADSGDGIPREFLPNVFDRFAQADSSTTRRYGGLGLGLSIVKQLVELHGGSVAAESEGVGKGSTFRVELPIAAVLSDSGARRVESSSASRSLAGVRVLAVDDEPDARELIAQLLRGAGADVVVTGSAQETLAELSRFSPHVLVSDIGMPETDGYELIRRVRTMPPAQGGTVPAIALTAFAHPDDKTRSLLAGFQMHVAKPVEPDELIASVANLVRVR